MGSEQGRMAGRRGRSSRPPSGTAPAALAMRCGARWDKKNSGIKKDFSSLRRGIPETRDSPSGFGGDGGLGGQGAGRRFQTLSMACNAHVKSDYRCDELRASAKFS